MVFYKSSKDFDVINDLWINGLGNVVCDVAKECYGDKCQVSYKRGVDGLVNKICLKDSGKNIGYVDIDVGIVTNLESTLLEGCFVPNNEAAKVYADALVLELNNHYGNENAIIDVYSMDDVIERLVNEAIGVVGVPDGNHTVIKGTGSYGLYSERDESNVITLFIEECLLCRDIDHVVVGVQSHSSDPYWVDVAEIIGVTASDCNYAEIMNQSAS